MDAAPSLSIYASVAASRHETAETTRALARNLLLG